ncbi:hypothetical protein Ciccas_007196 [Cichlidogyrus casuarinus]|uniref:Uncharacterized protein n=1 Tax=Cichlidogyrus casuarinus TaxID=1844966 RepID=A0ABD2Q486_9PLAT
MQQSSLKDLVNAFLKNSHSPLLQEEEHSPHEVESHFAIQYDGKRAFQVLSFVLSNILLPQIKLSRHDPSLWQKLSALESSLQMACGLELKGIGPPLPSPKQLLGSPHLTSNLVIHWIHRIQREVKRNPLQEMTEKKTKFLNLKLAYQHLRAYAKTLKELLQQLQSADYVKCFEPKKFTKTHQDVICLLQDRIDEIELDSKLMTLLLEWTAKFESALESKCSIKQATRYLAPIFEVLKHMWINSP